MGERRSSNAVSFRHGLPGDWLRKALIGLALCLVWSKAVAEPTPAEIAVARRLFAEAEKYAERGQYAEAASKLREAIAIKETPGLRFHLANAEEKQGHLVEAQVEYDRAGELIRQGEKAPDVAALLGSAKAALRARIPTVTIRVPRGVEQPRLAIDGEPVASSLAGQPIPLNPGSHVMRVTAPKYVPFQSGLQLVEGEDRVVEARLKSEPPPVRSPAPASRRPQRAARIARDEGFGSFEWILLTEGVITTAGMAVGVIYYLEDRRLTEDIDSANESLDRYAMMNPTTNPQGDERICQANAIAESPELADACSSLKRAIDDSDRARALYTAGFITAGAGGLLMIGTLLAWPSRERSASFSLSPTIGGAVTSMRLKF